MGSSARSPRPPRNTGPIELRDLGPNGRPLGTPDDCEEDSRWELHRGELVHQMTAKAIHNVIMTSLGVIFSLHTRSGYSSICDVYCDLTDAKGPSLRAPDVVVIHQIKSPKNEPVRTIPLLAVEIRATQSKKQLTEKVKLYLEHDWPEIWLVHTEREEVEVVRNGLAPVVYPQGTLIPLIPELDKLGLEALPVAAVFSEVEAAKYMEAWITHLAEARTRSSMLLEALLMRGFDVPAETRARMTNCTDLETLARWFKVAMTASDANTFVKSLG